MARYAGIVYRSLDQHLLHLPLQEVDVRVWMVDVSARVVLSQVFENESQSPTSRAKYVFPLPAGATTCAFELEHADGRVITGVAKEKSEAAKAFHGAVDGGRTAGLIRQVAGDMFTLSVGSIPARQKVTARLTFVMDLSDEGRRDHVRLQLPMAIAERCGGAPRAVLDVSTANERTRVRIAVDVQTSDVIEDIRSPTHRISLLRYKTHTGTKSEQRMTATWSSTAFLDKNFVLIVHARGLDEPRCFAEVDPQRADTIAMQLSFVPKFEMPRVASQEFIFVIDRSLSMSGAPMETAKRTLGMLLHLLPDSDTTFNIFSFASEVDNMRETSVPFNEMNMQYAISNIQAMQANDSGTGIAEALQLAVASRNRDRPTAICVLTYGSIHVGVSPLQREGMFARSRRLVTQVLSRVKRSRPSSYSNSSANLDPFKVVSMAIDSSRPNAPLKVFTLGIGEHVSSAVCERLAREGGGECFSGVQAEDIIEKCARLLNAGRTRVIESVMVDWHGSDNLPAVNFLPSNYHHPLPPSIVQLEPSPPMQQVPHRIVNIFPEMRFNVFAITPFRSVPREVRLRAKVEGLAEHLELVVPVTAVKQPFKGERQSIPLLHTLAARELIKHLAEGRAPLPEHMAPTMNEEVRKAAIVRLGLEYQLASQHTSFVAIESQREATRSGLRRSTSWERSRQQHYYASPPSVTSDAAEYALGTDVTTMQTVLDNLSQAVCAMFSFFTSDAALTHSRRQRLVPGSYYSTAQSRSSSPSSQSVRPFHHDNSSTDTFSTLSSLEGSSTNSRWTNSRSPSPICPSEDSIQRVPSPVFDQICNTRLRERLPGHAVQPARVRLSPTTRASGSVRSHLPAGLQRLVHAIASIRGACGRRKLLGLAADLQVDGNIWATAVAVAYLRYHLGAQPDLLHVLLSKPLEYVERKSARLLVGRNFSDLVAIAGRSVV
ncbi:vault protein inter-alpha-trypsin domain-containing protein [Suillus lakei]|nr:vault protein inter-alpha-trypsin domain-containing protein [Suillus lakei]